MGRFAFFLLFAIVGCGPQKTGENDPIRTVIRENVDAMNAKDVERVMATFDSNSDGYTRKKEQLAASFEKYDIAYTLPSVEVEKIGEGEAEVRFIQEARRKSGPPDFRDYRAEGRHLLRKDGDRWKIYETVVEYNEYLYR